MNAESVVGLVLAGGAGRRLNKHKGLQLVGGIPIAERVLAALTPVADEVVLVGDAAVPGGLRQIADEQPGAGPLAAIHTGMAAATADIYLVVAWDMPFVTTALFRHLLAAAVDSDAVVPVVGGQQHPLCAAYRRGCLPAISDAMAAGECRVISFFSEIRVRELQDDDLVQLGALDMLLFNVNTLEDLAQAERIAGLSANSSGADMYDGGR